MTRRTTTNEEREREREELRMNREASADYYRFRKYLLLAPPTVLSSLSIAMNGPRERTRLRHEARVPPCHGRGPDGVS
jgi:hypothetical protein